jgi:hypothetical protein
MRIHQAQAASSVLLSISAVMLAACAHNHAAVANPSVSAAVSSLATSTAGQDARVFVKKCVPTSAVTQVKLGHRLLTDTRKHPNGSWTALLACAGVTPANEPAIKDQALTAAEHVKWTSKPARVQYFEVTLPTIVTSYANIPGVSSSPTAPVTP